MEAVLFGELLETSRTFLCSTTRIPAHALLLSAVNVECDLAAERILIDRWCMLRVETPGGGESLLVGCCNRLISVYRFPRRALTLCPPLRMGNQLGALFPARSADALPANLYGHFTQAIYRNRLIWNPCLKCPVSAFQPKI